MNNPPEGCKPFNLERALAGDPVVTRHGKPVTQLTKFDYDGEYVLRGVLEGNLVGWLENGCYYSSGEWSYDLFMAPKKRTVWVNLYGDGWSCYWHDTKAEADEASARNRIGTRNRIGNRAYPVEIEE
jgi:hypothetical protein